MTSWCCAISLKNPTDPPENSSLQDFSYVVHKGMVHSIGEAGPQTSDLVLICFDLNVPHKYPSLLKHLWRCEVTKESTICSAAKVTPGARRAQGLFGRTSGLGADRAASRGATCPLFQSCQFFWLMTGFQHHLAYDSVYDWAYGWAYGLTTSHQDKKNRLKINDYRRTWWPGWFRHEFQ